MFNPEVSVIAKYLIIIFSLGTNKYLHVVFITLKYYLVLILKL